MGFQTDMRAACVKLLTDYAASVGIKLQVYSGRPRSLSPPTAFVDGIREPFDPDDYVGPTLRRRRPAVDLVVLHGIFDSKEAADQRDAFSDGFADWVNTRYHAAGANTLVAVAGTTDEPYYVPEWMPPGERLVYYATRITVEGLSLS